MRTWLFLLVVLQGLGAGTFVHWRGAYEAARAEAVEEGKRLLFLLAGTSDDGRKLLAAIGKDSELTRKISDDYVAVIVIADAKANYPIELYYTTKYPAIFLVDAKREIPLGAPCMGNASFACLRRKLLFTSTGEHPGAEGR
ncbi:hypothetical protein [Nitratifractor sp.]|uniref:hypothetical protein n=1 Tax=Nitratifractor sp. TaxID=2268144 RepID=UPI0025FCADCA|nr:hypothetical protein [Nitratifractor sp.]